MKKWKQALIIALIIIGVLVMSAVVIGILNATVFDGTISFGWTDYRYDATGYQVGEGTVYATEITSIDVDWLEGSVEIVACEDAYLSISEKTAEGLADSARVHWAVSEDGKTLFVKCRESGWFFTGSGEKKLTLRIPERMISQLTSLTVNAEESPITVSNVYAPSVSLSTKKGSVTYANAVCPASLKIVCNAGNVTLKLAKNESFVLSWDGKRGNVVSDFSMQEAENMYVVSDGKNKISLHSGAGDLFLEAMPLK